MSCRKFPSRGEKEKPGTLALLGLGFRIPTPGMVSQASHVSAVRECLSIKLFFGLGTGLKTAAVQGTPRVPRGGRVWILNPRGQSGTRRPL